MRKRMAAMVMAVVFMLSSANVYAAEPDPAPETEIEESAGKTGEETGEATPAAASEELGTVIDTVDELKAALAGTDTNIECVNISIPAGETVTLDLNGKTITTKEVSEGRNAYLFDNYGKLTIEGTGTLNCRGIQNFSTGSLTIDGNVQINSINTNGGACVWNEGGKVVINAGIQI